MLDLVCRAFLRRLDAVGTLLTVLEPFSPLHKIKETNERYSARMITHISVSSSIQLKAYE